MDAFFAAVEQRDNPALKGKPVIVGGPPNSRGVVAACSYEARKFGIHSAMPSSKAYRLCPQAVFVKGRFPAYREVSEQIREIFLDYTDLVEPLSLDEAFLDVTENKKGMRSASRIAAEIRKRIFEKTRLTASAGVSYNKFLAKVATDFKKPDGMTVITPELACAFIESLPIGKFYGIGKVTEKKMLELGINCGAELKKLSKVELVGLFGKTGEFYYNIVRGNDDRPVTPEHESHSLGTETTFQKDIDDRNEMLEVLEKLAARVDKELREEGLAGRTVTLKVKYSDFVQITRSVTLQRPVEDVEDIMEQVRLLLEKTDAGERKVRLLGVTVSGFSSEVQIFYEQLCFKF